MPFVDLVPGGRFSREFRQWLDEQEIAPKVIARATSFLASASFVTSGQAVAVLPDLAQSEMEAHSAFRKPLPWKFRREFSLLGNHVGDLARRIYDTGYVQRDLPLLQMPDLLRGEQNPASSHVCAHLCDGL